ncbi:hypothetical protein FOZ60_010780 [Perkinsus olseni]|uniref:Uncharacterized protein n=1 Tax=Perkinsus olseni TaxID=32597 RepID=A0A7J6NFN7_PEROL|nr:hypothetical protein FOZ60_010780 [Perkinsus olseni]
MEVEFHAIGYEYSYNVTTLESSVRARDISNDDDAAFSMEDVTEIYEEYGMNTFATVTAYPQGDPRIPVNSSAIVWRGNYYLPYHYYEVNFIPLRTGVYHLKVMCIEEDGHFQRALVLSPNTTTPLALTTDEEFLSNLTHTLTQHHGYADEGLLNLLMFKTISTANATATLSMPSGKNSLLLLIPSHSGSFRAGQTIVFEILLRDAFYNDLDANAAVPPLLTNPDNDDVLGSVVIIRFFNQSSPEVTQPFSGSCIHRSLPRIRCSVVPVGWASSSMMMSLKVMGEEIARLHHKYPTLDAHTRNEHGGYSTLAEHGPFPMPIIPGTIEPSRCRAAWPVDAVPAAVTAGEYEKFVIVDLFDAYGNRHEDTSEVNSILAYLQLQEGFSCSIPNDKISPSTSSFTIYLGCTTASSSAQLEIVINGQPIDVSSITPFPITPSTVERLTTGCAPTPGGSAWSSNTQYNWTCTMKDSYGNPISRDTLVGRTVATVIGASLHMRAMVHSQFLPLLYSNSSNASSRCTEGVVESFGISTTGVHSNGEFLFTPKFTQNGNYSVAVWIRQRGGLLAQYFRNPDFTSLVHHRSLVRHRTFTPIPYTTVAYNDAYGTPGVSLSDIPEATKARSVRLIGSVELRLDSTSPVEMRVQRAHPDGFGPSVSAPDLSAYSGYMLDIVLEYWTEAPFEVADDDRLTILETQGEGQAIVGQLLSALTAEDLKLIVEYEGDEYFVSTLKVMGSESIEVEAAVSLWKEDLRSRLGHKGVRPRRVPWDFSEWLTVGLVEAVAEARSVRSKHVTDKAEQRLRLAARVDDEIGEVINADSGKPAWDDEDYLLLSRIALACERDPNSRVGNYDKP